MRRTAVSTCSTPPHGPIRAFPTARQGVIRLDGDDFTWVWPVEGDVRDSRSQAYKDYHDYWKGRKPLLAPAGVDIFTENQDYGIYEGSPVPVGLGTKRGLLAYR